MKRAVFLHNQICGLLLSAYEHLQDHINKLLVHLNEFERKKINIGNFLQPFCHLKRFSLNIFLLKKKSIAKKSYANCAKSFSNAKTRTFWTIWQIGTWHNVQLRTSCNGVCTSTISHSIKPYRPIWPRSTTTNE